MTAKAIPMLKIENIIKKGMCSIFKSKYFHENKAKRPKENAATPYILAKPIVNGLALIKSGIFSAAKNKARPARISIIAVKRKNFLIISCLI
jgi:hypothetical protein